MTTVGKVLVVLHLVLSVIFMAFAGAVFTAQKNWRKEALTKTAALKTANEKLSSQLEEFSRERTDTSTKMAQRDDQILKLSGEKSALASQVLTLDADNAKLLLTNDNVTQQAQLQAVETGERTAESDIARQKNAVAFLSREELNKKLHEAMDKQFSSEVQLQQLLERHDRVLNDLKAFRLYNGSKGLLTDPKSMVAQAAPPPPLEGRVMDYRKEKKQNTELVEISLGSDDGLTVGHMMTVYNAKGTYLGQIRLTTVEADKAVGIVITSLKPKNTVIAKDDYVTTKL